LQTAREILDKPFGDPKNLHVPKQPKKLAPLGAVDLIVLFR
jgi:hypothetical protein